MLKFRKNKILSENLIWIVIIILLESSCCVAQHFENNCHVLSCDNKNKVNIGTNAVSRHLKIRKFHDVDDVPDYNDHHFPFGYKITPMGYMLLSSQGTNRKTVDNNGRLSYVLPNVGPLFLINRASKINANTIEPHVCWSIMDLIGHQTL